MEFDKLREIIAEVLNVDADEITMETTFVDDLGQIPWMYFRLLWASKRNLILRFQTRTLRRSYQSGMLLSRLKMQ